MRVPSLALTCLFVSLSLLVIGRRHTQDLVEIGRTYLTYHTLVHDHADILHRYSSTNESSSDDSLLGVQKQEQAPKIIHQIFLTDGRNQNTSKYLSAIDSCKYLHSDWEYKLWTDMNATAFMREHYPDLAPHYEGYRQSIQRANILRYALLHHYGGVYLDLDVTCLVSLDSLLHLPLLTPGAYPAGVNNAFILARPHHPFLDRLILTAPSRDLRWPMPYVENMLSTGCMFFTNRWMDHVRVLDSNQSAAMSDRVAILADENGDVNPHMLRGKVTTPLFAHGGSSSWHGWDAAVILLIGQHYISFIIGVLFMIAFIGVGLWGIVRYMTATKNRLPRSHNWLNQQDDQERMLVNKGD